MKRSRYTDSQILAILKQADAGTPVPDLSLPWHFAERLRFLMDAIATLFHLTCE